MEDRYGGRYMGMYIEMRYDRKVNYKEIIQLDGAHASCHANYGKSPEFNGRPANEIMKCDKKEQDTDTVRNLKKEEKIVRWENYWLEYINAFEHMKKVLPESVVTIYIGRQATEIGIKYLLKKKNYNFKNTHDLGELAAELFSEYNIDYKHNKDYEYMEYVDAFCKKYCENIEDNYVEYFRFPEYKKGNVFFAGENLGITWLVYNFSLILCKLLHFAGLDEEE